MKPMTGKTLLITGGTGGIDKAAAAGPDNAANEPHGDHQPRAVSSHHGIENLRGKGGSDSFPRDPAGLPEASPVTPIDLSDGATFDLVAAPVRKRIGGATGKMLGYGGSVPGPTLRVPQGAEVTVRFRNEMDVETTVHWHGLRHENRFDGELTVEQAGDGTTVITRQIADQAALHGVLQRIRDLGMPLISVTRIRAGDRATDPWSPNHPNTKGNQQ